MVSRRPFSTTWRCFKPTTSCSLLNRIGVQGQFQAKSKAPETGGPLVDMSGDLLKMVKHAIDRREKFVNSVIYVNPEVGGTVCTPRSCPEESRKAPTCEAS